MSDSKPDNPQPDPTKPAAPSASPASSGSKPNPAAGSKPSNAANPAAISETKKAALKKMGDYELLGKLGQGAMGAVYLTRHIPTNRKVALKLLPPEMAKDQEFLERFRREARTAMKLQHPNLVTAYDVGTVDKYHYIAMEYVDGPNLESMLKTKGSFKPNEVLKIAMDMCNALGASEDQKIVHRDIKPANILMNSSGLCKLTDLGLASASAGDQRVTMAGFTVGTPFYISPEQAQGQLDVDSRSDIYSLGATMYHLATGVLPFPGNNPVVIMTNHIYDTPPPPHERSGSVPLNLSQLIQKMMAKDPADRHQNSKELRADIEKVMRGEMLVLKIKTGQTRKSTLGETHKEVPAVDPVMDLVNRCLPFVPEQHRVHAAIGVLVLVFVVLAALLIQVIRS